MDIPSEYLDALIQIVDKYSLSELEVDYRGIKVGLRKNSPVIHVSAPLPRGQAPFQDLPGGAPGVAGSGAIAAGALESVGPDLEDVKSPLAGIFYRALSPDSEPFVETGDQVEPNQVLCIIEAMKVFNEIVSETSGTVREILPKNGDAVSEGAVLFRIERSGT
ncbi:MAG: acetyl-CoA carboxylase biotin carboxyl carrier protein [Armatimonadetes bacterium]|nr:acetyl-CoA carboxylase biotin carboxyl carrier protein [Armatimonadota bacterium]